MSFEILAAHCRDYLTSRFSDSKWKKKLFFFHYFQCKQCRPDWRTWDFDFPMTTRIFVKNIPQDTLVHLHWNTRVMSRKAPVQQMRVWKTTIPFSYFRTMILYGSQNLFLYEEKNVSFRTFYRTSFYRQTLALPSREHPLNPAYLCSLAFGVMTRWITKWTQRVGGLCQLYKFPDPGGDVVGPAYVGLYGSSVLV